MTACTAGVTTLLHPAKLPVTTADPTNRPQKRRLGAPLEESRMTRETLGTVELFATWAVLVALLAVN